MTKDQEIEILKDKLDRMQDERAAFEEWAHKNWPGAGRKMLERDVQGCYVSTIYRDYFTGWKARAALATQPAEQWPEDGLPPAGIKCEFNPGTGKWQRVFTVGIDDDGHMVVQTKNDGYECSRSPSHFRPIQPAVRGAEES